MKKLLSIAAVAAIVTSAFAFTSKGTASFCVFDAVLNNCKVITGKHIDPTGTLFQEYPLAAGKWDGQTGTCTGAANCSQNIRLIND